MTEDIVVEPMTETANKTLRTYNMPRALRES
jgi:hypothetical protein